MAFSGTIAPELFGPLKCIESGRCARRVEGAWNRRESAGLIVQPLFGFVRQPYGLTRNGFAIVAGARRFRAAQLAELFSLPARIVELTNAQAMEWRLVENSQRVASAESTVSVKRYLTQLSPRYPSPPIDLLPT